MLTMKRMKSLLLLLLLLPAHIWANNLVVSNISVTQLGGGGGDVSFGLSWQNSWRTNVAPFNWDAAWVFVKFRQCGVDPNTPWTHGVVSLASSTIPANLESTTRLGAAGIDADNLGLMLRRTANGKFNDAVANNITMRITNLPALGTDIDLRVVGIEMVFIPQGAFFIGDNNTNSTYRYYYTRQITSEAAIANLQSYIGAPLDFVNVPAAFPKGFGAFYCMKYEITHGQYATFLNTITSAAQSTRYQNMGGTTNRYAMVNTGTPPDIYISSFPDRAMNYIGWSDISAYLDWAALRPISEMEYEKVCRGSGPVVQGEFAWGNTTIIEGLTFSGAEDGTETFLEPNSNCNWVNNNFNGGSGGAGPCRVGIFSTSNPSITRYAAGASYFGVMEMTGNLWEYVIPTTDNAVLAFDGSLGDGNIDNTTGNHNVAMWPVATTAPVAGNSLVAIRGGSWGDADLSHLSVSGRYYSWDGYVSRATSVGGRGGR